MKHEQNIPSDDQPELPRALESMAPALEKAFAEVQTVVAELQGRLPGNKDLTGRQRGRLHGAQAKNSGFIRKAMQSAGVREQFCPPGVSLENMATDAADVAQAQLLLATLDELRRMVDDFMLKRNDALYRDALKIYGYLQTLSHQRVRGAEDVFGPLAEFFKSRGRRPNRTEPTRKELKRDFHSLLHGTADGEILVKHESPHMTQGVHEVVVKE